MVLPRTIAEASAQDPLLLLPLPDKLPPSPADQLEPLASALQAHLAKNPDALPLPAITGGMRTVTRNAQVLVNAARVGASEARAELDKEDVALRTTEYELARVREQMEQCRAYEPMYESMEMPDEESFLASAEPDVLASLPPEGAEYREYAMVVARLEAELAAIMKQEERLAELTKERDGMVRVRREVQKRFDVVDVYLADFAKTSNAMASKIRDVAKGSTTAKPIAMAEK